MYTIDDQEHVAKKDPIETGKTSPSDVAPIEIAKTSHIYALPVAAIIPPVGIVTRSPIEKEKNNISTCYYYSFVYC